MHKEILIIDQNKRAVSQLCSLLNEHHHVEVLTDGSSAIKRLEEGAYPDLIIMDPDLPDQPDWQLVERLSHDPDYSAIPLMVVSGGCEEETRSKVIANRVMDYFFKPFNPASIMRSVENIFVSRAMGPVY